MPQPRIVRSSGGFYHAVSRIVERRFYFGPREKEFFVATMRRLEAFLDVRVLTYCVMSNHFHLLLEVPSPAEVTKLTAESLRARLPLLYHGKALAMARDEIDKAMRHAASANGTSQWIDGIVARYQLRMGDLSVFLKELKWRFSRWYNAGNERTGTLWEDRFRSVLVEGQEHALMTIAAYIELNPVRAGVVMDPKDYRWSGYGEAVAGKKLARRNLSRMHGRLRAWQGKAGGGSESEPDAVAGGMGEMPWKEVAAAYRRYLFGQGVEKRGDGISGAGVRPGIAAEQVERVVEQEQGELTLAEALRCRVRYFTEGAVIGSAGFVEEVAMEATERGDQADGENENDDSDRMRPAASQSQKRSRGPRPLKGARWKGLTALRGGN